MINLVSDKNTVRVMMSASLSFFRFFEVEIAATSTQPFFYRNDKDENQNSHPGASLASVPELHPCYEKYRSIPTKTSQFNLKKEK